VTPLIKLAFLAAIVIAQTTVMASAGLGVTKPFLPLLTIVGWTLLAGPLSGAWWAVAIGSLLDLVSPSPWGFYTVPLLFVAVIAAIGRARLFPANVVIPWVVVGAATVVFCLSQRAFMAMIGGHVAWSGQALWRGIVPEAALNMLWLPVVYFPLRWVAHRTRSPRIEWEL
jgi:rod shape-determining protein MreD